MNLSEIINSVIRLSGRYDLVDDGHYDIVTNVINEACKFLDRRIENIKSYGTYFNILKADKFILDIPYCRAVKEVWTINSELNKTKLQKIQLEDLITEYLSSSPTSSTPSYYSPALTRKIPDDADLSDFSSYLTYIDTSVDSTYNTNAIIILPPTDSEILIEVKGLYYSNKLTKDTDENYWSSVYPMTLIKASLMQLELLQQNKSKYELLRLSLEEDLLNIEKDHIEEIITDITKLDG